MISRGNLGVFVTRPISGTILAVGAMVVVLPALFRAVRWMARRRAAVEVETSMR